MEALLGCWRVAQEQLGGQIRPFQPGTMVCVRPSGRAGVAITTTVDGKNVLEQTIVADGSAQPLSQDDCQRHTDQPMVARRRAAVHSRRAHLCRPAEAAKSRASR